MGKSRRSAAHRCVFHVLRRASFVVALVACLAPGAFGQVAVPYFTRGGDSDGRPGDVMGSSLRHSLTSPSAEGRWGDLSQFGRDLFQPGTGAFAPPESGPVDPQYVLGPGDEVMVYVSGYGDTSYALAIDREGKVFLPHVGSAYLWGLSFGDAQRLITGRISSVLRNAKILVSMGRMRTIDVFVLGEVRSPGKRTLTGLATAFHALVSAGGPTMRGSLRDVRILRSNHEVARFDCYPFLLAGDRSNDVRLESGDVVFIGPARPRAGIQGAVQRPAVYEMDAPFSLRRLLALAGGTTPFADLARIQIERVDANGGFRLQDLPLDHGHGIDPDSLMLSDYDLVTVLPLNERVHNFVTLDGYVRHPGSYELVPGMKLSALVTRDCLLPEAALDRAELRRVNPATYAVEVRPFNPSDVIAGRTDMELQALDAVTVFSSARMPTSMVLEGEVARPGSYTLTPGERLSSVIARAGGLTPRASLRAAVLTRASAATTERNTEHDFLLRQQVEIERKRAEAAAHGDSVNAASLAGAQAAMLEALERNSRPGRVVVDFDDAGRWHDTPRDPVVENGDRLVVPARPTTVTVVGSVKNPGTLLARANASSGDYVQFSGGTSREADLGRSYLLRANGTAHKYRSGLKVLPGDALVIAPRVASQSSVGRLASASTRWLLDISVATALIVAASRR
jgi:protein involved in polysaccharide export with SLBB domain